MPEDKLTVKDDLVVSLDYTLSLDSGEVIDSSTDREPLEFLQGRGQIITGLEQKLYGMAVGDEKDISVPPAEGYGEYNSEALQAFPLDTFPEDMVLQKGMRLQLQDTSGRVFEAFVAEVRSEEVLLDFNHPLAGETLNFNVTVSDLRPATSEELEHGHVHEPDQKH
jgi:FKBP-type peptidyl-prolyl cis-trans isomerase SlyD